MKNLVLGLFLASASFSLVANEVAQEVPVVEENRVEAPVAAQEQPAAEEQAPVAHAAE